MNNALQVTTTNRSNNTRAKQRRQPGPRPIRFDPVAYAAALEILG